MGKSDEETSFCCQYRDSYSGRVAFSQAGSVIVTESAGPSLAQPDTVSGVFRVQEGGAVDLPCLARGQPIPSYTWYKVGPLQSTAEYCGVLQSTAEYCRVLQQCTAGAPCVRVAGAGVRLSLAVPAALRAERGGGAGRGLGQIRVQGPEQGGWQVTGGQCNALSKLL